MVDPLSGRANALLLKLLDGCAARHRALTANVANADTPGYERKDVRFRSALAEAVRRPGVDAIRSVSIDAETDPHAAKRADGNSVCLDTEMAKIAENRLTYEMSVAVLRRKIAMVRSAITGRP